MLAKFGQLGWEGGFLEYPTGEQFASHLKEGGTVQNFHGGNLYSTGLGTFVVSGAHLTRYALRGYEGGYGYPTSDAHPMRCRGGTWQSFEIGFIVRGPTTGAFAIHGAILGKWQSLDSECGFLGFPMSDEGDNNGPPPFGGPSNGRFQMFQGSGIFWNRHSGRTFAYGEGGGAGGYYFTWAANNVLLDRADPTINFAWEYGSPHPNVPVDNFEVNWHTRLWVEEDGNYTFYTVSDDGVRLWVCPSEYGYNCGGPPNMIDNWTDHGPTENASPTVFLRRGSHQLQMNYYEGGVTATIRLMWSGFTSSGAAIAKQVIPRANIDPTVRPQPGLFGLEGQGAASGSAEAEKEGAEGGTVVPFPAPEPPPAVRMAPTTMRPAATSGAGATAVPAGTPSSPVPSAPPMRTSAPTTARR